MINSMGTRPLLVIPHPQLPIHFNMHIAVLFREAHPFLRVILLLLLSIAILSLLFFIGVRLGIILPLNQVLTELDLHVEYYKYSFLNPLLEDLS